MPKVHRVFVRVNASELERIKNNAEARGFSTVTAFIRSFALERDLWMEKKLQEIYLIVKDFKKENK